MIDLIQKFTSRYYVKGVPNILYRLRSMLLGTNGVHNDPYGIRLDIDISNYFQHNIIYGYYEWAVRALYTRILSPGDTVIDVGANIGYLSCLAGKLVGPEGRVMAIEPIPELSDTVKSNLRLNGRENVALMRCAAGDADGSREFYVATENSLSTMIKDAPFMSLERKIQVSYRTVDSLLDEHQWPREKVKLVKIDVEGHEYHAIKGMNNLIASTRPVFIIENNPAAQAFTGKTMKDIAEDFFFPHDYKMFWIDSKSSNRIFRKQSVSLSPITMNSIHHYLDKPGDYLMQPC